MKKLKTFDLVLLIVAALGLILAIVGLAVPWFTSKVDAGVLGSKSESAGLFGFEDAHSDFPLAAVQAFALISFFFAVAVCALFALQTLGVFKLPAIGRYIAAGVTLLFALLTMIFALVFAGQYGSMAGGAITFTTNAGCYLLLVGALASCVPYALAK